MSRTKRARSSEGIWTSAGCRSSMRTSAHCTLPSRFQGHAIFAAPRSRKSARTRRECTLRTHRFQTVWQRLRLHRNGATRGTCWTITIFTAPPTGNYPCFLCRTEGMPRFLDTARLACPCLRALLSVRVAVSTLGLVQHRRPFPCCQLCGVELVWMQLTVASAALVQALIPELCLSIPHTIR